MKSIHVGVNAMNNRDLYYVGSFISTLEGARPILSLRSITAKPFVFICLISDNHFTSNVLDFRMNKGKKKIGIGGILNDTFFA